MKKFHLKQILNNLSLSKFKKGICLEELFKIHPFSINFDLFKNLILNEKNFIVFENENKIYLKDSYYQTQNFLLFEQEHYNIIYLKTLFKEETNIIINIYKLLIDYPKITYQKICSEIFRLYNIKKDIKQISHYCMKLIKKQLIKNNQINSIEKINELNNVEKIYNNIEKINYDSIKETLEKKNNINNNNNNILTKNINFDYKLCQFPKNILKIQPNEKLSLNKFFISNRFSFIIDNSEIKNNIFFHLLLNKEKGLTTNEICLLCDFIGREKTLNKLMLSLEEKNEIAHKVMREGKKMEFLYFCKDENKIDNYVKNLVDYYNNYNSDSNEIKNFKNVSNDDNIQIKNEEQNEKNTFENNLLNEIQVFINNEILEDLNEIDYNFILNLMKENNLKITTQNENSKHINICLYILTIEQKMKKYFNSNIYNRYIFILNQIQTKKVLTLNELKQLILELLEKKKDYMIDRKTLKRILFSLEKMKLIKISKFELTMKSMLQTYLNEKEEIKQEKIIALRRDINENDQNIINNIIERIKPQKKSIQKNNNLIKKFSDDDPIKNKINNLIANSKINLKQKNIFVLFNKIKEIYNNHKINKFDLKISFMKLRRNNAIKNFSEKIFEKKDLKSEEKNFYMNINNYLEESQINNFIIPSYILNKKIQKNNFNFYDNDNFMNNFNLFSDDYYKKLLKNKIKQNNQINFDIFQKKILNHFDIKNFSENFLSKKRKFNDLNNRIKYYGKFRYEPKKKIKNCRWDKIFEMNQLIEIIYRIPGITLNKLKQNLQIGIERDGLINEFIEFLCNLNILKIFEKDNFIYDDTCLYIGNNFNLFVDV